MRKASCCVGRLDRMENSSKRLSFQKPEGSPETSEGRSKQGDDRVPKTKRNADAAEREGAKKQRERMRAKADAVFERARFCSDGSRG